MVANALTCYAAALAVIVASIGRAVEGAKVVWSNADVGFLAFAGDFVLVHRFNAGAMVVAQAGGGALQVARLAKPPALAVAVACN